jgi:transposase
VRHRVGAGQEEGEPKGDEIELGLAARVPGGPHASDTLGVYTPKHTSWLNQIELWFSILVRRVLKRGSFTSVEDLSRRILEFIEYFNRTMAKPFKWTYKGRPLVI